MTAMKERLNATCDMAQEHSNLQMGALMLVNIMRTA